MSFTKTLLVSQSMITTSNCGTGTSTVTYTYDLSRRLTRVSSSEGTTTVYTNWDTYGRPTLGNVSNGGPLSIVYDNGARTSVTKPSGSNTAGTTLIYDENGNLIMNTDSTGVTTTYTVTATDKICK